MPFPRQLQRKTDSPTIIFTLDLPVSLWCYGAIHETTCHLFMLLQALHGEIGIKKLNLQAGFFLRKMLGTRYGSLGTRFV